ncbi:MAG TPA: sulfite exporter TauE/SafE family protein [Gaiellaceae bacterium]|nr:sulfite exporter TauE/SafE family protein [Gaiellaceae bacterium]
MPSAKRSLLVACGTGVASGFLAALFGVGGGIIVVPALVVLLGFDARVATATSLAAIGITAVWGATSFSLLDHVDWDAALLVGLPALAGSLAGVRLQRLVTSRNLTLLFALFLVAVAVVLFLE